MPRTASRIIQSALINRRRLAGTSFNPPGYPLCAPLDHIAEQYEVRVADEHDQPVGDGEIGEIQVRGYAVTPRLHKIERSRFFTADGFYHTGDMGLVAGNRINFIGRNGDMIKTASANVSPAEVEMEIQALEGVHSAYVLGIPDPERGQLLVAAVVPRDLRAPRHHGGGGRRRARSASARRLRVADRGGADGIVPRGHRPGDVRQGARCAAQVGGCPLACIGFTMVAVGASVTLG